ncbi:MAG: hypothetical protein AAF356_05820 [Planctomycetota bacterium]
MMLPQALIPGLLPLLLAGATALSGAQDAPRATHTLLDAQRGYLDITLRSIDDGALVHSGVGGRDRRVDLSDVLALVPAHAQAGDAPSAPLAPDIENGTVVFELTDGSRAAGVLLAPGDDTVLARVAGLGERGLPIGSLALVRVDQAGDAKLTQLRSSTEAGENSDDRVLLRNGDVVEGFVLALGAGGVEIDTDGRVRTIALELVAGIAFANPATSSAVPLAGLADGRVVAIGVDAPLAVPAGSIEPGELVWLAAPGERVTALATLAALEPRPPEPGLRRRWVPETAIASPRDTPGGLGEIVLNGPQRWTLDLPTSGVPRRLGLRVGVPDSPWSDLRLTLRTAETVLADLSLSGAGERARDLLLDLPPGARTLTFEIGEGRFGPVRDELRIRLGHLAPIAE